jgi:hypothetical protein
MNAGLEALPDDIEMLKAALIVARAEAAAARLVPPRAEQLAVSSRRANKIWPKRLG